MKTSQDENSSPKERNMATIANIERFQGSEYVATYNENRPTPPAIFRELVFQILNDTKPSLVVDLGCGTGLSTRFWAGHCERWWELNQART